MTYETDELNFLFYFILTSLNLNCHIWLVAAVFVSATLEKRGEKGIIQIALNKQINRWNEFIMLLGSLASPVLY